MAKRHAHAIFCLRPLNIRSFRTDLKNGKKDPGHSLAQNLHLSVRSFNEIKRNGDLDAWAKWVGDRACPDYISQDRFETGSQHGVPDLGQGT